MTLYIGMKKVGQTLFPALIFLQYLRQNPGLQFFDPD